MSRAFPSFNVRCPDNSTGGVRTGQYAVAECQSPGVLEGRSRISTPMGMSL